MTMYVGHLFMTGFDCLLLFICTMFQLLHEMHWSRICVIFIRISINRTHVLLHGSTHSFITTTVIITAISIIIHVTSVVVVKIKASMNVSNVPVFLYCRLSLTRITLVIDKPTKVTGTVKCIIGLVKLKQVTCQCTLLVVILSITYHIVVVITNIVVKDSVCVIDSKWSISRCCCCCCYSSYGG